MLRTILPLILMFACLPKSERTPPVKNEERTIHSDKTSPQGNIYRNKYTTGDEYLTIERIRLNEQDGRTVLEFDVHWDASWRLGEEYDAAWVFIKRKSKEGLWHHLVLRPQTILMRPNSPSNEVQGTVDVSPDGMGMMIYRQMDGEGDNNWTVSVQLDPDAVAKTLDYRVFGLEMVHVPDGPFELGTLKGERARREVLTPGAGGAPYDPFFTYNENARDSYGGVYKVNSEEPIPIGKKEGNLYWVDANIPGTNTFSGIPEGRLETEFPKGFKGFYQMKYELSQQEYCDFLNTLTPRQQEARDLTVVMEFDRPVKDYRNEITKSGLTFTTSRPNRPCNFISWLDGQAYADWAGLRHMTELEFEKSCRGPKKAVYREYVWGVNEINEPENMVFVKGFYKGSTLVSQETGDEEVDGNIHASMYSYKNFIDVCTRQGNFYDPGSSGCRSFSGGDGGRGPVRKGIFGRTSGGDRVKAGGSYFGAMELGGNLQEPVVAVGHPSGRKFRGSHGNGQLTADGLADNADWQPVNGEYAFGGRGGCWKFHENHARTSDRFKGLRKNENRRASHIGFRGVRTSWGNDTD